MQLILFVSCWVAYLAAVVVGVACCALITIVPGPRIAAKRIAAGLIGSVPGVALCQLVALPVAAVVVGLLWVLHRVLGDLTGVALVVWVAVVVLGTVGLLIVASVLGFQSGWATGIGLASGTPLGTAVRASGVVRLWRRLTNGRSRTV